VGDSKVLRTDQTGDLADFMGSGAEILEGPMFAVTSVHPYI